ncbi:MAG TPA: glycerophosphodiester phosphodiesterase family protein [Thermoleophilaceae bacterium]|nr:glycerophosphodiester phosphodiesterase family protein [Thermoleophilaceae bacterium]
MRRFTSAAVAAALLVVAAAPAQGANRWIQKRAPLNIAHQGGEDEFPSNTLYAFRKAVRVGADMLELDVGVTKDNRIIVMHDTTVDGKTNGTGTVASKTLRQIRRLDAAYWFAPKAESHYSHDLPASAYRFRGIATGRRKPPRGFKASDFRVPTLRQVMRAFPRTPINIEIKGRTPAEEEAEYIRNAEVLARFLKRTKRRDLIVVSFLQPAVDRFHELLPRIDVAPGIAGAAVWLFGGGSPGPGVAAFQVPITFGPTAITTAANVARAHREGYAWQNWFSGDDSDSAETWRALIDLCVDGTMTAHPRAYERVLRSHPRPASCRP